MKLAVAMAVAVVSMASVAQADTSVDGYYRKDGTYVPPHQRTDPNGSRDDNWSSKGNTNPYTGQRGTRNPNPYK